MIDLIQILVGNHGLKLAYKFLFIHKPWNLIARKESSKPLIPEIAAELVYRRVDASLPLLGVFRVKVKCQVICTINLTL